MSKQQLGWYERLLPEQVDAADFTVNVIRDTGGVGLFSEQGTGKTIVSLAVIEQLLDKLDTILIVCPLIAVTKTWAPRLAEFDYVICRSWEEFKANRGKRRVLLIHFQLLSKVAKYLWKFDWDLVLIDECQGLKARGSGQSRAGRKLRNARRRIGLSGTPVDKSPIDVWAQMRFIDHAVLSEDWGDFAEEWCTKGGYMNKKWEFNPDLLDEFLATINHCCYRLSAEFLNLPPVHIHPVPYDLLGKQRRYYEGMAEHGIITLANGEKIKADLPITRKAYEDQIANGFILHPETRRKYHIGQAKERRLKALLRRIELPVVVACRFKQDIRTIKDALLDAGANGVGIVSGETRKTRDEDIDRLQAGQLDALICQIRSGGVSIEFTAVNQLIIYSMTHSFIDYDQLIKRLVRYGQKREVHIFLLYAQNTVDEEKIDVIVEKSRNAGYIVTSFERSPEMAAKKKAVKKATASKKKAAPAKEAAEEFKYGVADLADELEVTDRTARMKLRDANVKKAGRSYGWNTDKDFKAVVKKLKTSSAPKDDAEDDE